MLYLNENRPECIVTWDYKESPCWGQIEKAMNNVLKFDLEPIFIDFETNSDQHGVMIAPKGFTKELAIIQYEKAEIFFPDI